MIPSLYGMKEAIVIEQTKTYGLAMGLSQAEVDEVIRAWIEWAIPRPHGIPWDRVKTSMTYRANKMEWRP